MQPNLKPLNVRKLFVSFIVLLTIISNINAATYTASQNGDWAQSSTWGGANPAIFSEGDVIIIPDNVTVTVNTQQYDKKSAPLLTIFVGESNTDVNGGTIIFGQGKIYLRQGSSFIIYKESSVTVSSLINNSNRIIWVDSDDKEMAELKGERIVTNGPNTITDGQKEEGVPPLPISLKDFTSYQSVNGISLEWITSSELNNERIEILRSIDLINWEVIGTKQGMGTTSHETYYSFEDTTPYAAVNYYKLIQYDFNGDSVEHWIISQNYSTNEEPLGANLFPNPSNGKFTVVLSELKPEEQITYKLSTMEKDLSFGQISTRQFELDTNLSPGFYFITIYSSTKTIVHKIIIE